MELTKTEPKELLGAKLSEPQLFVALYSEPANHLEKVINSNSPSLVMIKNIRGANVMEFVVIETIRQIASLCNKSADKIINEKQAAILAQEIFTHYHWITVPQLKFAFMQGYKNQYKTKIFDCLEMSHFTDWLEEYDNDRCEYVIQHQTKGFEQLLTETCQAPKFAEELIRKRQLFELEQSRERDMEFETISAYCEYYNIDFKKLFAETNPIVQAMYNSSSKAKALFQDDIRFKSHIAKVTLNALNKYKPKEYADCLRISLDQINKHA